MYILMCFFCLFLRLVHVDTCRWGSFFSLCYFAILLTDILIVGSSSLLIAYRAVLSVLVPVCWCGCAKVYQNCWNIGCVI